MVQNDGIASGKLVGIKLTKVFLFLVFFEDTDATIIFFPVFVLDMVLWEIRLLS